MGALDEWPKERRLGEGKRGVGVLLRGREKNYEDPGGYLSSQKKKRS